METRTRNVKAYYLFGMLSAMVVFVIANARMENRYRLISLCFSLCFGGAFALAAYVIKNPKTGYQKMLILASAILIAMLPMMLNGFYYGDDLWGFRKSAKNITLSIGMRRPFNMVLISLFSNTSQDSTNIYRTVSVGMTFLCGAIMYRMYSDAFASETAKLVYLVLFCAGACIVDCIAYMSVSTVIYALFLSICSYYCYAGVKAGRKTDNIKKYAISFIFLLSAFFLYQIVTPIVFVLYVLNINKKEEGQKELTVLKHALKLLALYGAVAVLYLLSSTGIQYLYHVGNAQSNRGVFISSIPAILSKLSWFVSSVIPQSGAKIIGCVLGNGIFTANNMFYQLLYKNSTIGIITSAFILIMVILHFLQLLLTKRYATALVNLAAIPLSFYPFLILPESYTLTYYMLPIIALFLYYIIDGFSCLLSFGLKMTKSNRIKKAINGCAVVFAYLIMGITVINSSTYSNYWVTYNRDAFMYIKQSIAGSISDKTQKICVYGTMSPYVGGNPYVIFCCQRALEELGREPDQYTVLQADNQYYISVMTDDKYKQIMGALSSEEADRFSKYYIRDDMYNCYRYAYNANESDYAFMQECLVKSKQIVLTSNDNNMVIDLAGFNAVHQF